MEEKFKMVEAVPVDLQIILLEDLGGVDVSRMIPANRPT